jgi:hypothetical protein
LGIKWREIIMEEKLNRKYWWKLYEDGNCICNNECKYKKTKCSISAHARYYDELGKNIQLGKEIQLKEYKSQIIKFLETFVSKMEERAKDCYEKKEISNGERKIVPNAFVHAFTELLNNVAPSIEKTEILPEQSRVLQKYKKYIKRKPVDVMINKNPLVFIEFKTVLSHNDFGAALFESCITDKGPNGKFYILTIGFPDNYEFYKEIIKEPFFKEYIDGVFGIVPDGMNEFCDLLTSIKSLYK